MTKFTDLPLLPSIQKTLASLGFTEPTPIQEKVIPLLLENSKSDIHAQAQTGTGKTLAFGIPLLQMIDPSHKAVQALIVAPTRELVLQIHESLRDVARETGIMIEPIYGGMPITRQIMMIKRGAHILVGTPGRLNDHLRRKTLTLQSLKVLVLDEADIMLDMGFKKEVDSILECAPESRQIWLFSATVGSGITQLIKSHMRNVLSVRAEGSKGLVSGQVKQYFCVVPMRKRVEATARFIEADPSFYGIIFCRTKSLTGEVAEQLASHGFRVNCLHGDLKQSSRNNVIAAFKKRDFNILVATDVAARGIDVSDLTHVINFSVPDEFESYVHRIGRTGRAGKEGIAIMFVSPGEAGRLKRLERATNVTLQEIHVPSLEVIINQKMTAVSDFIEQSKQPHKNLSAVHTAIKVMIDSFSEEEIRHSFAVSLEDKFFKDVIHEDLGKVDAQSSSAPQEICMELGTDDGFSEGDVRKYLHSVCKVLPQELRKVRVLNKKTFIAIPENRLNDCLDAMRATPLMDRQRVYLVQDIIRERRDSSSGRSERPYRDRGGDRPRHGGGRSNDGRRGNDERRGDDEGGRNRKRSMYRHGGRN